MLIAMVTQALLLKAAGVSKEKTAQVLAEALGMLQQDSTQYQVISTAVDLLQKAKAHDIAVPGANLEVRKPHVLRTRLSSISVVVESPLSDFIFIRLAGIWSSQRCIRREGQSCRLISVQCDCRRCCLFWRRI